LKSYLGSDIAENNPNIRFVDSPYNAEKIAVVPPLNPDVAIIHAQRCDSKGNTQLWGLLGMQKEAAFAAKNLIIVVEEIVKETVVRSDPNRTIIPHIIVNAIVHQPKGTHPSYVQGYYDRDNQRYIEWEKISRDQVTTEAWLKEWIYDLPDWDAYLGKLEKEDPEIWDRLSPGESMSQSVNYGVYADNQGE
jgi:glutaconate CoA-transferase subunit A